MANKILGIYKDIEGKRKFVPVSPANLDENETATIREADELFNITETPVIMQGGQLHRYSIISVSNNAFAKVREIKYTGYPDSSVTTMTLLERLSVLEKVFCDIDNGESAGDITHKAYGIERNKSVGFVCVDTESLASANTLFDEMESLGLSPIADLIRKSEPSTERAPHYITSKQDNVKLWLYRFDALDVFDHFKPIACRDRVESVGEAVTLD